MFTVEDVDQTEQKLKKEFERYRNFYVLMQKYFMKESYLYGENQLPCRATVTTHDQHET